MFLETEYWAEHNRRFAGSPASPDDFHVAIRRGPQKPVVPSVRPAPKTASRPPGQAADHPWRHQTFTDTTRTANWQWTDERGSARNRDEEPVEAAGSVDAQNAPHRSLETTERCPQLPQALLTRGHVNRVNTGDISNES